MLARGRILAIETASEACSLALFDGGVLVAHDHRVLGRGHAEALVPMIAALPGRGRAERLLVSLGPGSFTGVRIGIAAARALGFAWNAAVLGYPTLALIAAQARALAAERCDTSGLDASAITISMNGGHGEWFVQNFDNEGVHDAVQSLPPAAATQAARHRIIAGNRAREMSDRLPGESIALDLLPDARFACDLHPRLVTRDIAPIYGRAPDARPLASGGPGSCAPRSA